MSIEKDNLSFHVKGRIFERTKLSIKQIEEILFHKKYVLVKTTDEYLYKLFYSILDESYYVIIQTIKAGIIVTILKEDMKFYCNVSKERKQKAFNLVTKPVIVTIVHKPNVVKPPNKEKQVVKIKDTPKLPKKPKIVICDYCEYYSAEYIHVKNKKKACKLCREMFTVNTPFEPLLMEEVPVKVVECKDNKVFDPPKLQKKDNIEVKTKEKLSPPPKKQKYGWQTVSDGDTILNQYEYRSRNIPGLLGVIYFNYSTGLWVAKVANRDWLGWKRKHINAHTDVDNLVYDIQKFDPSKVDYSKWTFI